MVNMWRMGTGMLECVCLYTTCRLWKYMYNIPLSYFSQLECGMNISSPCPFHLSVCMSHVMSSWPVNGPSLFPIRHDPTTTSWYMDGVIHTYMYSDFPSFSFFVVLYGYDCMFMDSILTLTT